VNSVLHEEFCRSCSFCAKLDQLCEPGQNSLCFSPKLNKYGEIRRISFQTILNPPTSGAARALITNWQALHRSQNAVIWCMCGHSPTLMDWCAQHHHQHMSKKTLTFACLVERWLHFVPNLASPSSCVCCLHQLRAICFFIISIEGEATTQNMFCGAQIT
jgi:hypothetical protein